MFFVFGKCPFLLRLKNVDPLLPGTHQVNVGFYRYMSGACTVIA